MELAARKRDLREAMAARRRVLSVADADAAGEAVADHLIACAAFLRARRVALYAAHGGELPTAALFRAARARGKPVLWPRVTSEDTLEFAACARLEDLVPGRHGVPAPAAQRPVAPLGREDLVVVPGLAFDADGGRLGRGGGHYDRSFPPGAAGAPRLVGVGYAFQVVESLPRDERDRVLDALVTERGVLRSAEPSPPASRASR